MHDVVDDEGKKIGKLEAVYVDTSTDEPTFVSVTTGTLSRRRIVFVPLAGATVGPGRLKVRFPKKVVRDAPSIDPDGELPAQDEPGIFGHYGLDYRPGASGERRLARR